MSSDTLERPEGGGPEGPADEHLTMGIDPWEKNWMKLSVALLRS